MSEVIDVYKFGQEILHIWHFLEIFVQITKNSSSRSCLIYNFAACKKLFAVCTEKNFTLMKIFCSMLKINLHVLLDKKHSSSLAICNEYLPKY